MRLLLVLALFLLATGLTATAETTTTDPVGDQSSNLPAGQFLGCRDPRTDVVLSAVGGDADRFAVEIAFDDLSASRTCLGAPVSGGTREGVVHVYTQDYPNDGHYLLFHWRNDVLVNALIFDPISDVYDYVPALMQVQGSSISLSVAREGTLGPSAVHYALDNGPVRYYGDSWSVFYGSAQGGYSLKDRFGNVFT